MQQLPIVNTGHVEFYRAQSVQGYKCGSMKTSNTLVLDVK